MVQVMRYPVVSAVVGILLLTLAGCQQASRPVVAQPDPAQPASPPAAEPAAAITCADSAIRLLDRGAGIHGAIVSDTLHLGGATTPVTCAAPANQSVAGAFDPAGRAASSHQSEYSLIVIRYPAGTRLYIISRRADGTSCVVDTNDACIAEVSDLPDGFDVDDLPDDVPPTIPGARPWLEAPSQAPEAAGNPNPRDGATGVTVDAPELHWTAGARTASYDLYWGTGRSLGADAALRTPVRTRYTAWTIRRPGTTAADRRLASATTYYWRVDAKNEHGTTKGTVWSFTTTDDPGAQPPPGGGDPPPVTPPAGGGDTAITISIADQSVTEGTRGRVHGTGYTSRWVPYPTRYRLPVRLSSATPRARAARLTYRLSDGTATSGDDYAGAAITPDHPEAADFTNGYLLFPAGSTSQTVSIYIGVMGDLDDEPDETFTVTISPPAPLTCDLPSRCTATVTIVDDD